MQYQTARFRTIWSSVVKMLTVGTLIFAACSSGNSADQEITDRIVAGLTATPTSAADRTDCDERTVTDEYGFRVNIRICDGIEEEVSPASAVVISEGADYATLDDFLGSDHALVLAAGIRNRFVLQLGCERTAVPSDVRAIGAEEFSLAVESIPNDVAQDRIVTAFHELTAADAICADERWISAYERSVAALEEFEVAIGLEPPTSTMSNDDYVLDPTRLTARAAAQNDRLYHKLAGVEAANGSEFWWSYEQFIHVRGILEMLETSDPPEVLVIGSSNAVRGVEPSAIGAPVDLQAVNVGLRGSGRLNAIHFADQILEIIPTPNSIVWAHPQSNYVADTCPTPEDSRIANDLDSFDRAVRLATIAFQGPAVLEGTAYYDRIFGSDASEHAYSGGPLLAAAEEEFEPWVLGDIMPREGVNEGRKADQEEVRLRDPHFCPAWVALGVEAIQRWESAGIQVMVAFTPMPDGFFDRHPDGRPGYETANAEARQAFQEAGAVVVDYSEFGTEGEFLDLTHLNEQGRLRWSDLLAEDLRRLLESP